MDSWDNSIDHHRLRHPSFSSTLLDQIYRSIDDSSTNSDVSMRKKNHAGSLHDTRVCLDNLLLSRPPLADDFVRSRNPKTVFFKKSSSSSSDSSVFSSSESDSFFKPSRSYRSPPAIPHPKPIRTTVERLERSPQVHRPNSKQEHGSFLRTKSKALKIYSDLKKVKQPISPGGRLATFINSIFTGAGNTKKPKEINSTNTAAASSVASSTTCSSASSFSRSCLSKTPSSSEKSKRSVRFCPVNVILDEDSKRCGHSNNKVYGDNKRESNRHHKNFDTLDTRVMDENRRVIEAAKELLRTYQKNKDVVRISDEEEEEEEEEDDDDAVSCASSDLFELDNLSAIGIDRYREELPVYETTRLNTNRIVSR